MNNLVKYGISFGCIVGMFILATAFHHVDATSGGIVGDATQIMFVSSTTGLVVYAIALVLIIVSSAFGRKVVGKPLTGLASWALAIIRVLASLAIISGGTSIYLFESKFLQFVQLILPISVIAIQSSMSSTRND